MVLDFGRAPEFDGRQVEELLVQIHLRAGVIRLHDGGDLCPAVYAAAQRCSGLMPSETRSMDCVRRLGLHAEAGHQRVEGREALAGFDARVLLLREQSEIILQTAVDGVDQRELDWRLRSPELSPRCRRADSTAELVGRCTLEEAKLGTMNVATLCACSTGVHTAIAAQQRASFLNLCADAIRFSPVRFKEMIAAPLRMPQISFFFSFAFSFAAAGAAVQLRPGC